MSDGVPRDVLTGRQSGPAGAIESVEVVVGYLVTHPDGYVVRFELDRARAELYAIRNHATLEEMYVRRRMSPDTHALPAPVARPRNHG